MRINFIRNIDYWFGIPVCFILSIVHRIQKIFISKKIKEIEPKKILFLELSEIGSVILAYSAIKKAKEMYPKAKIYFWIFKENEESIDILDIIPKENIITMRSRNFRVLIIDTIKNLRQIRHEKIDAIIDMELFSRFTNILSYLSGAKIRVGFYEHFLISVFRGNMQTHKVKYNPQRHISKIFLALVQSMKTYSKDSLQYEPTVPKIKLTTEREEKIWRKLKEVSSQIDKKDKIIILNPGIREFLPLRRWPVENYIALAKKLLKIQKIFIVLIGLKSQFSDNQFVFEEIENKRCINFAGKTSIKELIDLYNISTLLISHDSGVTNLASLTQINMIVLFGPETPTLYAPLTSSKTVLYSNLACSPCITAYNHRHLICKDNRCIKTITVEEVYVTAQKILNSLKDKILIEKRNEICISF